MSSPTTPGTDAAPPDAGSRPLAGLGRIAEQWERNASLDPFWVILGDPDKAGRHWGEAEFFATGEIEWRRVSAFLELVGARPNQRGIFVDFGCGVGRITRQLAATFRTGVGIDVSERMIAAARQHNPRLQFKLNLAADLGFIPDDSVDFVYSHIVLQHVESSLQATFIQEFLRILVPGGIAAFQVVTEIAAQTAVMRPPPWRRAAALLPRPIRATLKRIAGQPSVPRGIELEMHLMSAETVERLVAEGGGTVLAAPFTNSADSSHNGEVRFFDRRGALERLETERGASALLSRFFVVRAR